MFKKLIPVMIVFLTLSACWENSQKTEVQKVPSVTGATHDENIKSFSSAGNSTVTDEKIVSPQVLTISPEVASGSVEMVEQQ